MGAADGLSPSAVLLLTGEVGEEGDMICTEIGLVGYGSYAGGGGSGVIIVDVEEMDTREGRASSQRGVVSVTRSCLPTSSSRMSGCDVRAGLE